ncbi:MAG: hypothetical protein RIG62_01920 [Cyclobacteriaceae bacterium]
MHLLLRWLCLGILYVLGSGLTLYAQSDIPVETWRTHFSYQDSRIITITPERVYVAAEYGLFYLSKSDNSLAVLSKSDGLSDVGVTAMHYDEASGSLLLAYRSGVVDLVTERGVFAFTLIRDEADESEVIHDIVVKENTVYLATTAGVRVLGLDLEQEEMLQIRESYTRLSATGELLPIHQIAILHDSLFLATEEGVLANSLTSSVNRQDFNTWQRFAVAQGLPGTSTRYLSRWNEELYVALDAQGVFRYRDGEWEPTAFTTEGAFYGLRATADGLLILAGGQIFRLEASGNVVSLEDETVSFAQDAVQENEVLWVADQQEGLLRIVNGQAERFLPNGPASDDIRQLRYLNENLVALKGNAPAAFYTFANGQWKNFTNVPIKAPLLDATYSEITQQYYFASLGEGILQWDGGENYSLLTRESSGSTLANNQVTAVTTDEQQLWLANYNTPSSLHAFDLPSETWQQETFGEQSAMYPRQLTLDFRQQIWMLVGSSDFERPGSDLLVFDPLTNEHLLIKDKVNSSGLAGSLITDIALDLDGQLWLGGNEGVAFFPAPEQVFEEALVVKPVFERQFLLLGEYVTAIAVDGGNRKWIGTNDGLWLFSETGEELVYQFTTENSPLISNAIVDITIQDQSGEVFVATDKGVVSFRSTATRGSFTHQYVKLFPNPVRRSFDGLVGMEGLVNQATVKITTVSGVLVQEVQAQGGSVTWDLKAYTGETVQPGIYLVFSASADGTETFVGKLAVIP